MILYAGGAGGVGRKGAVYQSSEGHDYYNRIKDRTSIVFNHQ